MNAIELLTKQHRLVEELFDDLESAESREDKETIFEQLAANLVAHDAIEREIFYPNCEKELGSEDDVLGESLVEHGVVEFCLFRADKNLRDPEFDKYIKVLKETVEHHVEEEEKELLPKVKREMDGAKLQALGEKMEERFQKAMNADFRKPLGEALDQVLAGRTRTQKRPESKSDGARGARAKSSSRAKHAGSGRSKHAGASRSKSHSASRH
jgi:hypothetical protein